MLSQSLLALCRRTRDHPSFGDFYGCPVPPAEAAEGQETSAVSSGPLAHAADSPATTPPRQTQAPPEACSVEQAATEAATEAAWGLMAACPTTEDITAVLGLDCEMVFAESDPMALVRVSVVSLAWNSGPAPERANHRHHLELLLDLIVTPPEPVIDWRSSVTGLDAATVQQSGVSLSVARERVQGLLGPGVILVGHSLHHDLAALGLQHSLVIDTALLFAAATPSPSLRNSPATATLPLRYLVALIVDGQSPSGDADDLEPVGRDLGWVGEVERAGPVERGASEEKNGVHDSAQDAAWALDLALALIDG